MCHRKLAAGRLGPPVQEDALIDIDALVAANIGLIVGGLVIVVLTLAAAIVGLILRVRRVGRRLESLTRGGDEASLEEVLGAHLDRVRQVVRDLETASARMTSVERDLLRSFSRVGLVRFNPFEDTGGNQSFALALLNGTGDGFVVSSLHARAGTRLYAKSVSAGASDSALSDEEAEALRQAMARQPAGSTG
jgi:hypothetical protein